MREALLGVAVGKKGIDEKTGNTLIEIDPKYKNAYLSRADMLKKANKIPEAIADYTQVISLEPDRAQTYIDRGGLYILEKKYEEALSDYSQTIKLKPDMALAYSARGALYYQYLNKDLRIIDLNTFH